MCKNLLVHAKECLEEEKQNPELPNLVALAIGLGSFSDLDAAVTAADISARTRQVDILVSSLLWSASSD